MSGFPNLYPVREIDKRSLPEMLGLTAPKPWKLQLSRATSAEITFSANPKAEHLKALGAILVAMAEQYLNEEPPEPAPMLSPLKNQEAVISIDRLSKENSRLHEVIFDLRVKLGEIDPNEQPFPGYAAMMDGTYEAPELTDHDTEDSTKEPE